MKTKVTLAMAERCRQLTMPGALLLYTGVGVGDSGPHAISGWSMDMVDKLQRAGLITWAEISLGRQTARLTGAGRAAAARAVEAAQRKSTT